MILAPFHNKTFCQDFLASNTVVFSISEVQKIYCNTKNTVCISIPSLKMCSLSLFIDRRGMSSLLIHKTIKKQNKILLSSICTAKSRNEAEEGYVGL